MIKENKQEKEKINKIYEKEIDHLNTNDNDKLSVHEISLESSFDRATYPESNSHAVSSKTHKMINKGRYYN